MADKQLMLPGTIVKKSNAIARARSNFSVLESRIVALVATKVHIDDIDFNMYEIPLTELGVEEKKLSGDQYAEIKKALLKLKKAEIYIQGEGRNFAAYSVFSKVMYKNGVLSARFDPDLKPHFLQLKKNFTEYNLMDYLMLSSTYSQKLFEFLKSWASCNEHTETILDLFKLLNVPESLQRYPDFKRYVLEKAHKDINTKTSLSFEWEAIKTKNKVTSIQFIFSKKICLEIKTQKKVDDQQKQSDKNNQLFSEAAACAKSTISCVPKQNDLCNLCQRMGFKN